jgi:hypothetical protein
MEYGRRTRNVLLEYMMSLGGIPQQNCLKMGRRGKTTRGYTLHK